MGAEAIELRGAPQLRLEDVKSTVNPSNSEVSFQVRVDGVWEPPKGRSKLSRQLERQNWIVFARGQGRKQNLDNLGRWPGRKQARPPRDTPSRPHFRPYSVAPCAPGDAPIAKTDAQPSPGAEDSKI